MPEPRDILHVDMDAFFASVEQILNPKLRGKAVIVGGDVEGRSVVSAASYEARRYGVRSAMPVSRARKLCPDAVFVRGNFEAYRKFSHRAYDILLRFTPVIERMSLDDFHLDLTGCRRLHGPPLEAAKKIRRAIYDGTELPVSIGVASNKLVAKVASGIAKPNGILQVFHGKEDAFFRNLPVEKLPGIGKSTAETLGKFNLTILGEVAAVPAKMLEEVFGAYGISLQQRARGADDSPVVAATGMPKSISHEQTFAEDTIDRNEVSAALYAMTERATRRLREHGLLARCVTVKLRYADFKTVTAASSLDVATDMDHLFYEAAMERLGSLMARRVRIRLVGVALSKLIPQERRQGELFDRAAVMKQQRLYHGLDRLRERFGFDIISRGPALRMRKTKVE